MACSFFIFANVDLVIEDCILSMPHQSFLYIIVLSLTIFWWTVSTINAISLLVYIIIVCFLLLMLKFCLLLSYTTVWTSHISKYCYEAWTVAPPLYFSSSAPGASASPSSRTGTPCASCGPAATASTRAASSAGSRGRRSSCPTCRRSRWINQGSRAKEAGAYLHRQ